MAPGLTQMTPVGPEVVPLLVIITPGIPYAIGFALQASAQVPQRLMKQLNPRGLSKCLAGFVCLPAAATCASSLATSMQRGTSPSLFPLERERTFFSSWRDRNSMHEKARWGIKRRSGVAHDGTCCRGASIVVTVHLVGRFLGARGRPRSLANSLVQTKVPGEGHPALHRP